MINNVFMNHTSRQNYLKNIILNEIFSVNIMFMIKNLFMKYIYDKIILKILENKYFIISLLFISNIFKICKYFLNILKNYLFAVTSRFVFLKATISTSFRFDKAQKTFSHEHHSLVIGLRFISFSFSFSFSKT